ncbi:MAG TPA: phospholipase D-like domain-containing protein [Gammaproteobacteria bacterium]|nr:phospholipase D-like domain-containing protein [Gammaproteobacteria bacterium]
MNHSNFERILRNLMNSYDEYHWAAAWGTVNRLSDELVKNKSKIEKLIFGTHFWQTDPELLECFKDEKFAKAIPHNTSGTFHPKVYLFTKGHRSAAIVGSANFTKAAMGRNKEIMLLIEGDTSSKAIQTIRSEIESHWELGKIIDKDFLDNYRLNHKITARLRAELAKERIKLKPGKTSQKELRLWTWEEYAAKVRQNRHQNQDLRLELLREARQLFSSVPVFARLNPDERRAIAGFLGFGREHRPGLVMNWGWFGSMKGPGEFKNLILEGQEQISEALEHIPLTGEIRKDQYDGYISLFMRSFAGRSRQGGVASASRLLCMKRPDTFICVNSQNRRGLATVLGFSHSRLDFKKYWDDIIAPITESIWWQTDRPVGPDGKLWDVRTAMLDAIYYIE